MSVLKRPSQRRCVLCEADGQFVLVVAIDGVTRRGCACDRHRTLIAGTTASAL